MLMYGVARQRNSHGVQPTNADTLLSLGIELLFAIVFLRAVREYARHRDPINRDVILVFSAMAALFVAQIVRIASGIPQGRTGSGPGSIILAATSGVAIVLLLLQPLLTL